MVGSDGLRLGNAGCWFSVFVKIYSDMCIVHVMYRSLGYDFSRMLAAVRSSCVFTASFLVDVCPSRVVIVC